MMKKDFVNAFSAKSGITKKDAERYMSDFLEVVMKGLEKDDSIKFVGFGEFKKKFKKGKTGTINVGSRKGEEYKTEDHYVISFKPGKLFKDKVNGIVEEESKE